MLAPSRADLRRLCGLLATAIIASSIAYADVLNDRYDAGRTGANLLETILTISNINSTQFGRLWTYPVDGAIYAQPLYKAGVVLANGTKHNVLYVATMNNKVYAFDADSGSGVPLWWRDFRNLPLVAAADTVAIDGGNQNVAGNNGIISTPVIDPTTNTMYFISRTIEVNGTYIQRLRAIDITTGADKFGGQVEISAQAAGSAPDAVNGIVNFSPKWQNPRTSLALVNGVVLAGWASHEDITPWHGWIMGFNASTLAKVGSFCTTPDGYGGGVWQSSRGPAVDPNGYVYYETGNGTWDGTRNFASAVLKLKVSTASMGLAPVANTSSYSYYTPSNQAQLTNSDNDLSATGPFIIPNTSVMFAGSKADVFYQLSTTATSLGGFDVNNTTPTVTVPGSGMKSGPAYWTSASLGGLVFIWTQSDYLRSYRFNGTSLSSTPYATGADLSQNHPGGAVSVSSNGAADASGIVWTLTATGANSNNGGDNGVVPGILRAYQATTLSGLWNSESNAARDRLGNFNKFVVPVVQNGRVYTPTQSNSIAVYGLLTTAPAAGSSIGILERTASIAQGQTALLRVTATSINSGATLPTLTVSGLPTGVTSSIVAPASLPGTFSVALKTSNSAAAGVYTISVASSGGTTDQMTLTVTAPNTLALAVPVSLSSNFSIAGLYNDGTAVTGNGFDGSGYAYSSNAVGSAVVSAGVPFHLGAPNAADVVSGGTVTLPSGYYSSLAILGSAVFGAQGGQTFTITYADGSTTHATQSISDWCSPQGYAGEIVARSMAYRLNQSGAPATNCSSVNLYEYSIPVTASKLVKTLALPGGNVRVLAVSAIPAIAPAPVSFQSVANVTGIFTDSATISNGGLDSAGYSYSGTLLGTAVTWSGLSYGLGSAGVADSVSATTIALPATNASSLRFLGTAVNGNQPAQTFTVAYTDGTTTIAAISLSDWCSPQHYAGESIVKSMSYRDVSGGTVGCGTSTINLFGYSMVLDPSRTPKSLTLPNNRNVVVMSAAMLPPGLATPVPLGTYVNVQGSSTDGGPVTGGALDGSGYAYALNAFPPSLQWLGTPFVLGPPDTVNALTATTLQLPAVSASSLKLLATGASGNQSAQSFTVTYTDGSTSSTQLSLSDWCGFSGNTGERIAFYTLYRTVYGAPTFDCGSENVYGYTIPIDSSRTAASLTLPNNNKVVVLAVTMQ